MTGKPENLDAFEEIRVQDVSFFIHKELLKTHLKGNEIIIGLEGYGRFIMEIGP